jgi:putative Mg2+ transporter-C (MgtC) family protein
MIIVKNNNVISGLTTAAGIWSTSIVGIALGCGFYIGAVVVAFFMLLSMVLLARFERAKRRTEAIYIEIDDMSRVNAVIDEIFNLIGKKCPSKIYSAKSGNTNNIGVIILLDRTMNFDFNKILEIEHVLYVDED